VACGGWSTAGSGEEEETREDPAHALPTKLNDRHMSVVSVAAVTSRGLALTNYITYDSETVGENVGSTQS